MHSLSRRSRSAGVAVGAGGASVWRALAAAGMLLAAAHPLPAAAQAAPAPPTASAPNAAAASAVPLRPVDQALRGLEAMARKSSERFEAANATPALTGSGPYPAMLEVDLALPIASLYHPADLNRLGGRKLGVLIWGNGGCSNDGASAAAHLAEIASHGYLVIAPGKPLSAPITVGAPAPQFMTTTIGDMRAALDWALAENGREGSPYFQKIDPAMVAVSGHSCGGMLAILLGQDPRVKAVIIHNSGINALLPDNPPLLMHRERLQGLHTPVLFVVGGKVDVAWPWAQQAFGDLNKVPVFIASLDVGHGGTFQDPHGGAGAQVATAWLEWRLRGDTDAAKTFVGADCRLCQDPRWSVQKKGMP